MQVLLDPDATTRGLRRVANELIEHPGASGRLVLIAIGRGGVPVARDLRLWLRKLEPGEVPLGTIDVELYEDGTTTTFAEPRVGLSSIPCSLDGARVVLVDDVIQTGRTVRAAIGAVTGLGRPRTIELCTLVNRGGRVFPIQPDFFVRRLELPTEQRVDVLDDTRGLRVVVQRASNTLPPLPSNP